MSFDLQRDGNRERSWQPGEHYDFIVCGAGPAGCALAGPSGHTMAPCVVIGERAADIIRTAHGL